MTNIYYYFQKINLHDCEVNKANENDNVRYPMIVDSTVRKLERLVQLIRCSPLFDTSSQRNVSHITASSLYISTPIFLLLVSAAKHPQSIDATQLSKMQQVVQILRLQENNTAVE